ncbi:ricin-type beta-trefoil lectin domain protein [Nonomuraea sp. NPDC049714]|uniref:ricin-type beta-trefoil lectin domain protein n=1 Tax=Nonomuraea sp. NPDC049714 TaxID=3364357 RepID=UPI0037AF6219
MLEVQGTPSPGASVVAGPQSADAQNELWCVPGDGHIISRLDASLVLAPADASQGAGVVVQTLDATNQLQLWNVTSDGYIVSRQTGYVLTAPDTSGGQVVVEQQSGDPEAEQLWSLDVAGPVFGPPQVSYSTVLSEDYVGSNEVLVDAASENQVAMFRNPQTGGGTWWSGWPGNPR